MKIFSQVFEIFDAEMVVCVGIKSGNNLATWLKKFGVKKVKNLLSKENIAEIDSIIAKRYEGFIYRVTKDKENYYFLYLRDFKNSWQSFDVLLHELVHYKQLQWENKRIKDEFEFEAYFVESCYRVLRRKLFKILKI
jgi:hypothetical protein